jgi:hypothetical protein
MLQQVLDDEAADVSGTGTKTQEGIRGLALREFERFLDEHDPDHTFAGLQRVVTTEGQACWTAEKLEDIKKMEKARENESVDPDGTSKKFDLQPATGLMPLSPYIVDAEEAVIN